MHTLNVDLGERSYPIYIGSQLLDQAELLAKHVHGSRAIVITNTTVGPLYLDTVTGALEEAGIEHDVITLEDGEQFKTLQTIESIITRLLEKRYDRKSTLIALGGGVVGDITGFAASIYQRGINFIQIPTTLLSQVDSSVGGKTGVNHPLGKNMIGAFYQPQCVIADINTLHTLPQREFSAGMAEVIKYGLIHDAGFFAWLEDNAEQLCSGNDELIARAVLVSCETKAKVVELDERESGLRAILNLGHTFGHAIEAVQGYGNWLHGEAVAAGMMMAIDLSIREGWIAEDVRQRSHDLISKSGLPVTPPNNMTEHQYREAMSIDKKVVDGTIKLILLESLGKAVVTSDYQQSNLTQTLSMALAR